MRKKSLVSMVAAMGLVAAIGVGATLAFLSAETKTLTNTFTFTDQGIDLRLDEALVKNGEATEDRTTYDASKEAKTQDYGKVLPGATLPKDPMVTVKANSINCYVFASITDPTTDDVTIVDLNTTDWLEIKSTDIDGYTITPADNTKYYVYKGTLATNMIVPTSGTDQELGKLFTQVKIADVPKAAQGKSLGNLVIKSAAIQSDNNTYAAAAVEALGKLGATVAPKQ